MSNSEHEFDPDTSSSTRSQHKHVDFDEVFAYLFNNTYPPTATNKGIRANFRRQCKPYLIENGELYFNKEVKVAGAKSAISVRVVKDRQEQLSIVHSLHAGPNTTVEAMALSSHRGRDTLLHLIAQRYYWHTIRHDVVSCIKHCDRCQKVNPKIKLSKPQLHSIPVPTAVMSQVGVDLIKMPLKDGYQYAAVLVDYFTKWPEAAPLKDKTAPAVAQFLFEVICRHGCFRIQINDQGREFCNETAKKLSQLTGTTQRITSSYHPQANGLVERLNRTIKSKIMKVLDKDIDNWLNILAPVLFALRSSRHSSTGYTPFQLLYCRQPRLPSDGQPPILEDAEVADEVSGDEECEQEFLLRAKSLMQFRCKIFQDASKNIKKAQARQKKAYDRRHEPTSLPTLGGLYLVKNLRREDRKGGWFNQPWLGPYEIVNVSGNLLCTLKNPATGINLKKKQHISNLKLYNQPYPDAPAASSDETPGDDDEMSIGSAAQGATMESDHEVSSNATTQDTDADSGQDGVTDLFVPPDARWQTENSAVLGLSVASKHRNVHRGVPLAPPKKMHTIRGDGNCFFRAVSYCLTGSEQHHAHVRSLYVRFAEQPKIAVRLNQLANTANYAHQSAMQQMGTWATDVEVLATAAMLQTSIYCYVPLAQKKGARWCKYDCAILGDKGDVTTSRIYLQNTNGDHYDVVERVQEDEN